LTKNYVVVNQAAEINAKLPGIAYVYVLNKKHSVVAGIFGDKKRFNPDFIDKTDRFGFPKEISSLNKIPFDKVESSLDYQVGGQKIHDVAVRIGHGNEAAHVGLFTENAENTVRRSLIPLLIVLIVFTLLGCLSFLLVARTISTPIRSLTQAAERLSLGEIESPIQVRGSGEIRDLAASLERMRFSIKEAINRLKRISTVDEHIAKTGT
jgi:methyl-accepting chemotaxis protein